MENLPSLIMLIGPSYSGKSTLAKELDEQSNYIVHSSDQIRQELLGDANDQSNNAKVFEILHRRVCTDLRLGCNVVYDACNLSMKKRKAFLQSLKKIPHYALAIVCVTNIDELYKRAETSPRERRVPKEVITKQLCAFQCPNLFEGFDNIGFLTDDAFTPTILAELLTSNNLVKHDNPHHLESITDHAYFVYNHLVSLVEESDFSEEQFHVLCRAGLFHDIGKYATKTFKNKKGQIGEVAHYYGHASYGAYLFLTSHECELFEKIEDQIQVATLIQYHMESYIRPPHSLEKFYSIIGKQLEIQLKILHDADLKGRTYDATETTN